MTSIAPTKRLSQFEANLVRIARFAVGAFSPSQALPLILQECPKPPCLSRACNDLVQETLAKGCIHWLARSGGWQVQPFVRHNQVATGRLWHRTPPAELALHFSRHSLDFLVWLTAVDPTSPASRRRPPVLGEPTPGDALLCYHVCALLRETAAANGVRQRLQLAQHALTWLAFADDYQQRPPSPVPDFGSWMHGVGACILEAMQPALAAQVVETERRKAEVPDWLRMLAIGRSQAAICGAFLDACQSARRPDLAAFLLDAAAILLPEGASGKPWLAGLKTTGPRLADRLDTNRAAFALLLLLQRLQQWERQVRAVGYFDEGYAASQWWKNRWEERGGELLCGRAETILRAAGLLPMETGGIP